MPERPCVSVVIPTRNRRARLERALRSVLAQTWRPLEVIVIDDASTDETSTLLSPLQTDGVRWRCLRNETPKGGAAARNQGIATATGTAVAFLDDDDTWLPEKIERQMAMLAERPEAVAVTCSYLVSTPGRPDHVVRPDGRADEQHLLWANDLGGASVCLSPTGRLRSIGGFDATLPSAQDWDLWIRLRELGPIAVCQDALVRYDRHDGPRISTNTPAMYVGRRKVFFRYRAHMSAETHDLALALLLSCRFVAGRPHAKAALVLCRRCCALVSARRQMRILVSTARMWRRVVA